MSSSTSRFTMPSPRHHASVLPSSSDGHYSPRSSYDHHAPSFPGQEASTSRRPSKASLRQSPTSMSSSSLHDDMTSPAWDNRRGRLPRIRTSMVEETTGPVSAPLRSPGALAALSHNGPTRSSSSPVPTPARSGESSPGPSPSEQRPSIMFASPGGVGSSSHLAAAQPGAASRSFTHPPASIPPRSSSQTERSRPISPVTFPSADSHEATPAPRNLPEPQPTGQSNDEHAVAHSRSGKRHEPALCGLSTCGKVVTGQFVRAMGRVYHLDCFRCKDCGKQVAQKFFPVEDPEGMYPLCERDYFARLDLICSKCNQALRSSYITACGKKYHVEHFSCSECDVLFGSNDSYYEHGSNVYCHYHYSVRFAVKCVGCETAILKQFVEMNRNGKDECWHPECYMMSKFWNVRLASKTFNTPASSAVNSVVSLLEMSSMTMKAPSASMGPAPPPNVMASPPSDSELTPDQLKEKQERIETKVQQIWHVLSGYEESAAALIGDMLKAVHEHEHLKILLLAERFILYVEVLFAVIDDLEAQFALVGVKGMSHAREAKHLCRRLVNVLSAMANVHVDTQDLFGLITQLAHYLKILIRVALTGAIKLERDYGNMTAMPNCLARLNLLAMDNGDPTVKRRGDAPHPDSDPSLGNNLAGIVAGDDGSLKKSIDTLPRNPQGFIPSTQGIAYGYRSLAPEVTGQSALRGPIDDKFIPTDQCGVCTEPVEEDCVRLGMFHRWHPVCVICVVCGDKAGQPQIKKEEISDDGHRDEVKQVSRSRRRPPRVDEFFYEPTEDSIDPPQLIYCLLHRATGCKDGFKTVSRLEQYAYLLHVALRRLYIHFKMAYGLPSIHDQSLEDPGMSRVESDTKRVKSVTLDRKISSTARVPQRSTVVESPAGRMAITNDHAVSARTVSGDTASSANSQLQVPENGSAPNVNVIRPAFARNNTSVRIVQEPDVQPPDQIVQDIKTSPSLGSDDNVITLDDIPLIADQTIQPPPRHAGVLVASLDHVSLSLTRAFAIIHLQKSSPIGHLVDVDDYLDNIDLRKQQWWNDIFKGSKKNKKKGVFGVSIESLVMKTGSDSQLGASNNVLRVPEFVEDIVSTMRQMDMAIEGIFRKNGNIRRLQSVADALDKDSTQVNLSEENPVQLAALLKRWLREMPDPLLTFKLHKLFCAAAALPNADERRRCLHLVLLLLPKPNRDTMEVLFVFLRWVATFAGNNDETGSKMDTANLATVIAPSILYAKGANAARDESFMAIQAVQCLLENQDDIYHVPREIVYGALSESLHKIFVKEASCPPKELYKHCLRYYDSLGPKFTSPSTAVPPQSMPPPVVPGQLRERPSDPRMSIHRPDVHPSNGVGHDGDGAYQPGPSSYRHQGPSPIPVPVPVPRSGNHSRPTSWVQVSQHGSQQSLHTQGGMNSPGGSSVGKHQHQWRGPFQGHGHGATSRNSSRESAPSSPGPERRSFQMERERSWQGQGQGPGDNGEGYPVNPARYR